MASIDLRKGPTEPVIDEIIFGSEGNMDNVAHSIGKNKDSIKINTGYYDKRDQHFILVRRNDIPYLLEAIEKAKELNWV